YMATINKKNNRYIVAVKGAPDVLIPKCNMSAEERAQATEANRRMTEKGLRVLAVAECETDFLPNNIDLPLRLCGLIGISDPPRPEIYDAIKKCKKSGIRPVMITGDHAGTASAIAKEIGMSPYAVTGIEINKMSDAELRRNIKKFSVFARVTPEHKVRIVRAFQANGEVVAMTGDGVNDAPALKQADIGCAMGITGTDVAKSASDMILTDDNFATIVSAVYEGRSIFENIKKAMHFLLSSNIGEILTILCAIIAGLPAPLTAVQLLWVNLITDSLPALALGVDTNNMENIICQKPIKRNKSLFADGLSLLIFLEGIMIGTLALVAFCIGYFKFANQDIGRTMAFCVLSISQLVHSFNVRSDTTIFSSRTPKNKMLFGAFVLGVILQVFVITNPLLSGWFSTAVLNTEQWKITALLSVTPIVVIELSKMFGSRRTP
ncbi:MAG: HAD-IC family P-type ATPase, partial [Clostridia bacterium]|nr:HAD-IC family P-type ATPase [Clostridia bacterium]